MQAATLNTFLFLFSLGNGVNCLRIFRACRVVVMTRAPLRILSYPDYRSALLFSAYSAVQFTTFESLKRLFTDLDLGGNPDVKGKGKHQPLGTGFKLVAGSLAGIASVR